MKFPVEIGYDGDEYQNDGMSRKEAVSLDISSMMITDLQAHVPVSKRVTIFSKAHREIV